MLRAILILSLLDATANGQQAKPQSQPPGGPKPMLSDYWRMDNLPLAVETTEPKWTIWPGDNSTPYRDVHSRFDGYPDVHECSHQLMNFLNNRWNFYSQRRQAIYCMEGRIVAIAEPPLTLVEIGKAIPLADRGSLWDRYFSGRSDTPSGGWNQRPLYVLNEWASYSNEWTHDHTALGLEKAQECSRYASVLLTLAERCPDYDTRGLRTFVEWHTARVEAQQAKAAACTTTNGVRR